MDLQAANKRFFATIDESCRQNQGGGIDDENIEVVFIPKTEAYDFILNESYPKTSGVMFAFLWFLKILRVVNAKSFCTPRTHQKTK